jgi:predicted ester cyclase
VTPDALVRAFYADIWEAGRLDRIAALMAMDVTFRGSLGPTLRGRDAFTGYVRQVRGTLESYRCEILTLLESQSGAAARMRFSGLHTGGPLLGVQPTGRRVCWEGAAFFDCAGGLISDLWVLGDLDGLREQLAT